MEIERDRGHDSAVGRGRRSAAVLWLFALSLLLWGCGGHPISPQARLCLPRARGLVARTLALPPARIATVPAIGNDAAPQCSFRARLPGGRFDATVNVDVEPQPYTILSRTIVEGQQVFSPVRLTPAPVAVLNLGLLASWFPGRSQLMSTDGVRMVTATVNWPRAKQASEIQFATRISRLYLHRPRASLAHGYPAGG
jgi:hypothetical protein